MKLNRTHNISLHNICKILITAISGFASFLCISLPYNEQQMSMAGTL
jgi:hypothetical protein